MDLEQLGNLGEFLGSIGVIVSLIYLGFQIKNQNAESRLMVINVLTQQWTELMKMVAENEEFADIWLRGLQDYEGLSPVEKTRMGSLLGQLTNVAQGLLQQYQLGRIDQATWEAFERRVTDVICSPGGRSWWPTRKHWFSEPLQTYYEKLLSDEVKTGSYDAYTK